MPYKRSNKSIQDSAFKLRSGNRAAYSDLQKESPAKLAFLAPLFAMLGGGAAGAAGTAAAAGLTGAAATTAATAGAVAAGKAVAGKAVLSAGASKLASGGKNKKVKPIIEEEQTKIMKDDKENA